MALTWLDMISNPQFSSLTEDQRRKLRENWIQDKVYTNPYTDTITKDRYADWFRNKTDYSMDSSFTPMKDWEDGMTSYMKAFSHGAVKGLTGGWLGLGGREKLYDTEEERQLMENAGLQTEKKWGWIDDAEHHNWTAIGGELASFAVPLGILSKFTYIPRALRLAAGGSKAIRVATKLGAAALKGGEVGAMYGLLKKPSGPEWEQLKSPLSAPWTDKEFLQQKISDTLIDAGIFAGADIIGASIGAGLQSMRLGKIKKSIREFTAASNALKKTGKLKTDREAMYRVLDIAKKSGLEQSEIIEEVAKELQKAGVLKEEVPKLVETWMKPPRSVKELEQLDLIFGRLQELGGARVIGQGGKELKLLEQLRKANPEWSEEQLVQGVFDAVKTGKKEFVEVFGEGWVPKFELRIGDRPIPIPSRMGQDDLKSTIHNIREVLTEIIGEAPMRRLGQRASHLYDQVALAGSDLLRLNREIARVAAIATKPEHHRKLIGWLIQMDTARRGLRLLGMPPRDLLVMGDSALKKWEGLTRLGQLYARWTKEDAEKLPFLKDIKAKRRIFYYLNNAEVLGKSIYKDFGVLTNEEKEVAGILRREWDSLFEIAKEAGVLENYIDNYAPLIWKDKSAKIKNWAMSRNPITKAEVIPAQRRGISRVFQHAYERTLGLENGILNYGMRPVEDPIVLMESYQSQLYKCIANRNLSEALQALKVPYDGHLVSVIAPVQAKLPGSADIMWKRLKIEGLHGDAKVAPFFYNQLKDIFDPWARPWENKFYRAWSTIRNKAKKLIMYNPIIHAKNIVSDVLTEQLSINPISWVKFPYKTWKTFTRGKELWKTHDKLVEEFVLNGGSLEGAGRYGNELWENVRQTALTQSPAGGFWAKIMTPLSKLESYSDKILWSSFVKNAQLGLYAQTKNILKDVAKKQGTSVTEEMLGRASAHYVNDLMGTLPRDIFGPFQREFLSTMLFARNWTVSNLRLVTGALGVTKEHGIIGSKDIWGTPAKATELVTGAVRETAGKAIPETITKFGVFDFLRHGGLSPVEMQLLQQRYVRHLIKGTISLIGSVSLGQLMLCKMTNYLRDKGILDPVKYGPNVPIHGIWSNPAGHRLDMFTGITDPKGRPVYVSGILFAYIKDLFSWAANPTKTAYNKWEPLMKGLAETLMNRSIWKNEPITPPGKEVYMQDWLKAKGIPETASDLIGGFTARFIDGGKYILESATPVEQLWGTPGYNRKWWEILPSFGGTYVRRGLTTEVSIWTTMRRDHKAEFWSSLNKKEQAEMIKQWGEGIFKGEIAKKLLRSRQKWDYEKDRIDNKIDELLQDGRFDEAFKYASENGRYLDTKAWRNRLRRYYKSWLQSVEENRQKAEKEVSEEEESGKKYVW